MISSSMLQIITILILLVLLIISLTNLRNFRKLGNYPSPDHYPFVSILVPARNEEGKISSCINSLLAQNYPDFEIIVLLDHSKDRTENILQEIAAKNKRLRILTGKPLPSVWLGKHWACHQLAQAAKGELLLFTDADTVHKPDSLRESVAAMIAENADLLTALPKEKVSSLSEKIILPLMPFGVSSILPIKIAHSVKSPLLSITIGQFMLFKRKAYEKIGGYSAVRDNIADDMA
ncbi:MAG: glycosyltransferase, partial [Candidatus Marinimicrobia bacterium]|nr:glycosyltransferase [Candidatus Neomarinimicrobiota bacterium]